MIESNFEYTENLINKINACVIKKYNLFTEIAMFIILLSCVVLFITHNVMLGIIFCIIFICLLVSLIISNKGIEKSNKILIGQQVKVVFNEHNIGMTTKLGNRILYNAKFEYNAIKKVDEKKDLMFIYFDKISAIIVPRTSFKTSEEYKKAVELAVNNYTIG